MTAMVYSEYSVVVADNVIKLAIEVNEKLQVGFIPIGGVSMMERLDRKGVVWMQAVARKEMAM